MKKKFKSFWYESSAAWGKINSLADLKEKMDFVLKESNGIDTVHEFLKQSKRSSGLNFGTRIEHSDTYTLESFLIQEKLLEEFINMCK